MGKSWQQQLEADQIVLIDGAIGTELQRRGVPMDKIAWCGAAVLGHPDAVRETHEDYIRAGSRVITTNTFGSTRQMLEPAGYGDQVEAVHWGAVELARLACDNVAEQAVAVAGSISTEPPGIDRDAFLLPEKELAAYREAADLLVDAGVGCKKRDDGKIVSFDYADLEFATVLDAVIPLGPTGVYPESGYFTKPNWNFVDVIPPADLVSEALRT